MGYFSEFRTEWRAVTAAAIGHGGGVTLNAYIASIFAPHLSEEFGWTRSQFALVSMNILIMLVCFPIVGRLVDTLGVRRVATVSVLLFPLTFVAFSMMSGNFYQYFAITILQIVIGSATTQIVYTRLVAPVFQRARGLALAIVSCAPPVFAALLIPLLAAVIEDYGWRTGYLAIAAFTAVLGGVVLTILPRSDRGRAGSAAVDGRRRDFAKDYALIVRSAPFWILILGIVLCSVPQTLHGALLQLMLLDNGAPSTVAAYLISLYALSVMVGRFACGLALDKFPSYIVAAIGMGVPAIGLALLASSIDAPSALAIAVLFIGLSQGAEADICSYLVAQYFAAEIYGSVMGMVGAAIAFSAAGGALALSLVLKATDSFTEFITIGAACVLIGAFLFLLLGREGLSRKTGHVQEA